MKLLAAAMTAIAPPACSACGRPSDDVICTECEDDLPTLWGGCPGCALPGHRGRPCPAAKAAFDVAWAPVAYDGAAREVVRALKFHGRLPLAAAMAERMAAFAPVWVFPPGAALVAVPPVHARRRSRGFDPAALLAHHLGRAVELPVEDLLRRRGPATRQAGASRRLRRAPGRVTVEAIAPGPVVAVLVDDVHTTGATLDACARALRGAGTDHVIAVTYARTL
jgi:predicted amidophosphoribosyltransferase